MRRRTVLGWLAGAAAGRPRGSVAQPAVPVVGFLRSSPATPFAHLVAAFRRGLGEAGFVEGRNVTVEYRWGDNRPERLPALAADLVRRNVAAIIGNSPAAEAARAVTTTIPIVFVAGDDPVRSGLVTSMNRPSGNLTGVTFFGAGHLAAKRTQLLDEVVPGTSRIAVLVDPNYAASSVELPSVEAAGRSLGRSLGRQIVVVKAGHEREFEAAFSRVVQAGAGALVVFGSAFFTSQRRRLVELAARHALPAIYDVREYVEAGGLMSYGASISDAYRLAGLYVGRILRGARPGDLPVTQPTEFELVVNLRTARALGLTIPAPVLTRADEVIQ
jgi:putative ABC transport system substrate-binding protein